VSRKPIGALRLHDFSERAKIVKIVQKVVAFPGREYERNPQIGRRANPGFDDASQMAQIINATTAASETETRWRYHHVPASACLNNLIHITQRPVTASTVLPQGLWLASRHF